MLQEVFTGASIEIEAFGNVRAATGLFYGLVVEDMRKEDLLVKDRVYPVVISAVVKIPS